jgi:hypothetical protein
MDQFNTIFFHFPQCRIIICKECGVGMIRPQVKAHINSKHGYLTVEIRKTINQVVSTIGDLADCEAEVIYPNPKSEPIPHLPVWRNRLKCTASKADGVRCEYIRHGLQNMQMHCRDEHGWESTRKRGRPSKEKNSEANKMWVENVHCQKFNGTGILGRLFEVTVMSEMAGNGEGEEDGKSWRPRLLWRAHTK